MGLSPPSLSISKLLGRGRALIYYWQWILFMEQFLEPSPAKPVTYTLSLGPPDSPVL